jgi:hypothetical protein
MLVDCVFYFLTVYLRAHKREPLLLVTLLNGALLGASTWIFGRYWGSLGVAVGNFGVVLLILPLVISIFWQKRRLWHSVQSGTYAAATMT